MRLLVLCLGFVVVSYVVMRMQADLQWQAHAGERTCKTPCEQAIGAETCESRGLRPTAIICRNLERMGGRLAVRDSECQCPFVPLLQCQLHNSTSTFTEITTGDCAPNPPICWWALSCVVALLIAVREVVNCLCCGMCCGSSGGAEKGGGGFSIPGFGAIKSIVGATLGSGVAGPAGIAASKVVRLL